MPESIDVCVKKAYPKLSSPQESPPQTCFPSSFQLVFIFPQQLRISKDQSSFAVTICSPSIHSLDSVPKYQQYCSIVFSHLLQSILILSKPQDSSVSAGHPLSGTFLPPVSSIMLWYSSDISVELSTGSLFSVRCLNGSVPPDFRLFLFSPSSLSGLPFSHRFSRISLELPCLHPGHTQSVFGSRDGYFHLQEDECHRCLKQTTSNMELLTLFLRLSSSHLYLS